VNYLKHYLKLMRKAEQRGWTKKSAPCYVERHHIFIKAIFGENGRVVYLTAKEHFVAHLLLWKACRKRYGVQHWKTAKTAHAVWSMSGVSRNLPGRLPTAWQVAQGRVASSEAMQGDLHWTRRIGVSNQTRVLQSLSASGRVAWTNGVINTYAKDCPGEGWERGLTLTEDQIEARRNANLGKVYGKRDPEVGRKISAVKRGVPLTLEHRDALSVARRNIPVLLCEHCGKEIKGGKGNLKQHIRIHGRTK
jgi:hypothetical protein